MRVEPPELISIIEFKLELSMMYRLPYTTGIRHKWDIIELHQIKITKYK